jgi:hypothetical protein
MQSVRRVFIRPVATIEDGKNNYTPQRSLLERQPKIVSEKCHSVKELETNLQMTGKIAYSGSLLSLGGLSNWLSGSGDDGGVNSLNRLDFLSGNSNGGGGLRSGHDVENEKS